MHFVHIPTKHTRTRTQTHTYFSAKKMTPDEHGHMCYFSATDKVPVRWSAPESLSTHRYTSASDVWSFGVCMYELFANGEVPYTGMTNMGELLLIKSNCFIPKKKTKKKNNKQMYYREFLFVFSRIFSLLAQRYGSLSTLAFA